MTQDEKEYYSSLATHYRHLREEIDEAETRALEQMDLDFCRYYLRIKHLVWDAAHELEEWRRSNE